jgi:hypothetical protein
MQSVQWDKEKALKIWRNGSELTSSSVITYDWDLDPKEGDKGYEEMQEDRAYWSQKREKAAAAKLLVDANTSEPVATSATEEENTVVV